MIYVDKYLEVEMQNNLKPVFRCLKRLGKWIEKNIEESDIKTTADFDVAKLLFLSIYEKWSPYFYIRWESSIHFGLYFLIMAHVKVKRN